MTCGCKHLPVRQIPHVIMHVRQVGPVGRMQLEILSGGPAKVQRRQDVYAIHGPNAATELGMLAAIHDMATSLSAPLRAALLERPPQSSLPDLVPVTAQAVQEVSAAFGLNEEQAAALQQVAPWFDNSSASEAGAPVCAPKLSRIQLYACRRQCCMQVPLQSELSWNCAIVVNKLRI